MRLDRRAAVGGNYDFADDTENGRIRLCIDAGSSLDSEIMGTAARDTNAFGAVVPKKSRLVARGVVPNAVDPASSASSAKSPFPQAAAQGCVNAEPACHSSTAPLRGSARNDTYPAVLQFIRTIVVPTGRGAILGTEAREYGD